MASDRQIAANRRNALRSTGPRSMTGKLRSRRNALAHGLAARILKPARPEAEALAKALLPRRPTAEQVGLARAFADLEVELWQLADLVAGLVRELEDTATVPVRRDRLLRQLAVLDRYRGSLLRRKISAEKRLRASVEIACILSRLARRRRRPAERTQF